MKDVRQQGKNLKIVVELYKKTTRLNNIIEKAIPE